MKKHLVQTHRAPTTGQDAAAHVLFVASHEAVLKEMLLVSQLLAETRSYRCTYLLTSPVDSCWIEQIEQQGHPVVHSPAAKRHAATSGSAGGSGRAPKVARLRQLRRHVTAHVLKPPRLLLSLMQVDAMCRVTRHRRRLGREVAYAAELFDQLGPDLLLVPGDRSIGLPTALLAEAARREVDSLVLPWAVSVAGDAAYYRLSQPNWQSTYGMRRLVNRLVARRFPQYATYARGQELLFQPGEFTLAAHWLGIMPPQPWQDQGIAGLATRVAVESWRAYDEAIAAGIDPRQLAVTGRAAFDALHETAREAAAVRRDYCQRWGADPHGRLLLCSVPQMAEHQTTDWQSHLRETDRLIRAMTQMQGVQVVLSLHPKSERSDYAPIAARYQAVLAREPIEQLIPICDAFVCTASSTVMFAISCCKPTILLDHYGMNYELFHRCPGTISVKRLDNLLPTLISIFEDRVYYEQLRDQQRRAAAKWTCLDGQCGQRIINQIDHLLGQRQKWMPAQAA